MTTEGEEKITVAAPEALSAQETAQLEELHRQRGGDTPGPVRRSGRVVAGEPSRLPGSEEQLMQILERATGRRRPGSIRPALAGAGLLDEEQMARADRLAEEADRDALLAAAEARKANRHASYLRTRNPRYADRSFANLKPQQRMNGLVENWLDSPTAPSTLVMLGNSRAGKTGAAYSIDNEANNRGLWVEVLTAHEVGEQLRADKTAVWQRVTNCDVLHLDDLGRERVTDWWRDFLQELVNFRHGVGAIGKRMIVTANTSPDRKKAYEELLDRYGDPIVERLMDHAGVLMFDGPPIRTMVTSW